MTTIVESNNPSCRTNPLLLFFIGVVDSNGSLFLFSGVVMMSLPEVGI
jgi:hypothetical protein